MDDDDYDDANSYMDESEAGTGSDGNESDAFEAPIVHRQPGKRSALQDIRAG